MGPKSRLRKRSIGVEGVPIGRLLSLEKRRRDALGYFPNSFSTSVGDHCGFIAVPKLAGNKAHTKAQSERAEVLAEVFKK